MQRGAAEWRIKMGKYFAVVKTESGFSGTVFFDDELKIGDIVTVFYHNANGDLRNSQEKIVCIFN